MCLLMPSSSASRMPPAPAQRAEPLEWIAPMASPHIVIIGGGFGGLYAARELRRVEGRVTVIDRRNFHLFQPLLYQVATAALNPSDSAAPIRSVLRRQKNASVILGEAERIDPARQVVVLRD